MKTIGKLVIFVFALFVLTASAYAADDNPLFEAVIKGDKTAVEALLVKGAGVNARNRAGQSPLDLAAYVGRKVIAELLLSKGADINAKDPDRAFGSTGWGNSGWVPLNYAIFSGWEDNAKWGPDMVEWLLAKGADINPKNAKVPPLHGAASQKNKSIVELLLAKGANVNFKDSMGASPLHRSMWSRDVSELLIAKGADINAKDQDGETPLHGARNVSVVELLLDKGADVNAKDKNGKTPLDVAVSEGKKEIVELLREYQVKQARLLEDNIKSNPRAALVELSAQLMGNPTDHSTRRLIIKLASELKPAPAIPEEARKHFVEGTAIVKAAKNPAQQALAAQSFSEALKIAPWWGDAYYNLGVAQELAEKYDEAEQAFNFYLLSNPSEAEKREVQDRIYGLSAKRKLAGVK